MTTTALSPYYMHSNKTWPGAEGLTFSLLRPQSWVRLFGALCVIAVLKGSIAHYPPHQAIYQAWVPRKYLLNYLLGKHSFQ